MKIPRTLRSTSGLFGPRQGLLPQLIEHAASKRRGRKLVESLLRGACQEKRRKPRFPIPREEKREAFHLDRPAIVSLAPDPYIRTPFAVIPVPEITQGHPLGWNDVPNLGTSDEYPR